MEKPYSHKRWWDNPMPKRIDSQCYKCKHYNWDGTCKAFPEGMSKDIILNEFIHKKPYPGDNGIQYEE